MRVFRILTTAAVAAGMWFHSDLGAQGTVQWASGVEAFSSQFVYDENPQGFLPQQALGPPSSLPGKENVNECAWTTSQPDDGPEYIHLSYERPMPIRQVAIVQPSNPGAVVRVTLFGLGGEKKIVLNEPSGMRPLAEDEPLYIRFALTPFPVSSVRIDLDTRLVYDYNQIDAVAISDSEKPVKVGIRLVKGADIPLKKERLPSHVNSKADELNAVISADGKRLYFTRLGHPKNVDPKVQDVWYSVIDNKGGYGEPVHLGYPINNDWHNSLMSITPDGQRALLLNVYLPDGGTDRGISMSTREGDKWGFPEAVKIDDYYNKSRFGEYTLSADGKTLLLAIQRDDGQGSKDIHVSFRKGDGSWTVPQNLGPVVNTAASEVSPFLGADGVTLYYATSGKPGYGSRDVFITRRLDESWTNWTEPENLGPHINTPEFDAYYTIPASGEYAYFINTLADSKSDIFRVKLPESARPKPVVLIRGRVLNAKTGNPVGADIMYESLLRDLELGIARSDAITGEYSIVLPAGDHYGFLAQAQGFAPVSENLDLVKLAEYGEIEQDLMLVPLEEGQIIRLGNIFFDTGKYSFRKEAMPELKRLVALLENNPSLRVEVAGHTDDVGSEDSNLTLSRNRAKAVYDYLVKEGIAAARLDYKGYGENKPITRNDTPEGRQENRRVEFVILSN